MEPALPPQSPATSLLVADDIDIDFISWPDSSPLEEAPGLVPGRPSENQASNFVTVQSKALSRLISLCVVRAC